MKRINPLNHYAVIHHKEFRGFLLKWKIQLTHSC
jgi:hypothetical protein